MGSLNIALDKLFDQWKSTYECPFVKDGLMLKNEQTIDVENLWLHSKRRIAFLVKDQNQGKGEHWDDDARLWLRNDWRTQELKRPMFRNIANLFYGLSHASAEEYAQIWYGELNPDKVKEYFNHFPFAFIECKKVPGYPSLKDRELGEYLQRDSAFLSKEIEILNPNILVCCGGPIFDFVVNMYGKCALHNHGINGNLKYAVEKNTVLVYCEHPAKRFMRSGTFYDVAMDLFRVFLKTEDGKMFSNSPSPARCFRDVARYVSTDEGVIRVGDTDETP